MSNATHDSRNPGDSRRRRSRGGSNRNRNRSNNNENRGERDSKDSRNDRGNSQDRRQGSPRSEEFRPQAPRKYAPPKLTFWQKILSIVGLYKAPAPPSRYDRKPDAAKPQKQETTPFPKSSPKAAPKSNTRNARSEDGDSRPPREAREPREKRDDGDRPARKERTPRGDKPRGGDPKSVESNRVYVGNLSYDVSEQDLQELFKGVGGVRNVEIVYNRSTHRSKGYGFVEMLRMDDAVRSVEVLHDQPFMGRKLTVSGAKSKGQDEREDADSRDEVKPVRVELAPLPVAVVEAPADETAAPVVEAAAEPVIETIVEKVEETTAAVAETVSDLEAKYGFDEPKEKSGDA